MHLGLTTSELRMSLWNCMRKSLALAPPSTRRLVMLSPESCSIDFAMSYDWYASDSSVALMK